MPDITTAITVAGNLTRNPELRVGQSGKAAVRISIAVNERVYNPDKKDWEDGEPSFIDAVAFGTIAENIEASYRSGERVLVTGRMKQNNWVDKDSGIKRSKLELHIDDIGGSVKFGTTSFSKGNAGRSEQGQTTASKDDWAASGVDTETPW